MLEAGWVGGDLDPPAPGSLVAAAYLEVSWTSGLGALMGGGALVVALAHRAQRAQSPAQRVVLDGALSP